jgi:dihydroorotase-like cyclic amidohydrolase
MTTLIKNGTLITASETFQADILIENEKIICIGLELEAGSAQVIDATGKFITPGGVDPHTQRPCDGLRCARAAGIQTFSGLVDEKSREGRD